MTSANKLIQASAGNAAGAGLAVEDVFSTYLYTGNDSVEPTIVNGIDLENEGGLVWIKSRDDTPGHYVFDTERGLPYLIVNSSAAQQSAPLDYFVSYNSDGFTGANKYNINKNDGKFASWTFRKAPKFFDVVTYTGDGVSGKTISHNLGSTPGCVIIKRTDSTSNWTVWHRSLTAEKFLRLNLTDAEVNAAFFEAVSGEGNVNPTDSVITLGNSSQVNANSGTYVAYLFAHNDGDGEFGEDGDQDIIKCGSYTGANTYNKITLGFEPQMVIVKAATGTYAGDAGWRMFDNMRNGPWLYANSSNAETGSAASNDRITFEADGFSFNNDQSEINRSGYTYIYIAIRRGPMKTPESGTEVFATATRGDAGDSKSPGLRSGFPVDWLIWRADKNSSGDNTSYQRLTASNLYTHSTGIENVSSSFVPWFAYMDGWLTSTTTDANDIAWMFRRAPGFFDVVAFTHSGSLETISHNLGVVPELMIVKQRDATDPWYVWHKDTGHDGVLQLQSSSDSPAGTDPQFGETDPTSSEFTWDRGNSGETFIAYLFASVPGVSKIGSYTGDGTDGRVIDCGFSSGARFILSRSTANACDWNVFDTERGIVAGNDPRLELNTTDSESSNQDHVDPESSGYIVNTLASSDLNNSGETVIFLAIA